MKHLSNALTGLLLLLGCAALQAQGAQSGKILVKGIYDNGRVLLRWIPEDFPTWQKGNMHGYQVIRQLAIKGGQPVSNGDRVASTVVFDGPFVPLSEPDWEPFADTNDIAAVAAGALYSEDFEVAPMGGADDLFEAVSTNEINENRFGFGLFAADQAFWVAEKMGLAMVDSDVSVDPTDVYTYQVILLFPDPALRPTGIARIPVGQGLSLPAPAGLQVSMGAGMAMLSLPRGDLESHYTSFNLERSDDNGETWIRRNDKALVFLSNNEDSHFMMFTDTVEQPGVEYRYRMRGMSPFGIEGPPSNPVAAAAPAPALGIYPHITGIEEINEQFVIQWEFPVEKESEIQHFQVFRSFDADAGFELLPNGTLSSSIRTFTDPSPGELSNYYKIVAIDNGDNPNPSHTKLGQLNDTEAPAAPNNLSATVDESGLVTLNWDANTEADLKGYRVFFSNNPNDDFAQITSTVLTQTSTTHQLELKVLTKKVYYRMLATDLRENDSPYSAVVSVSRPDVVPPAKPVITRAEPLPDGVHLEWKRSESEDLARHELQRKQASSPAWETLSVYSNPVNDETTWIDSTTRGIADYSYRLLAYDSAGLASSSTIINVRPQKNNLDTIANFKIASALDGAQKQAKLSWEYPKDAAVREFQIYRSQNATTPHFYATMKINPEELAVDPVSQRAIFIYKDKEIASGYAYRYQVLAKYPDGSTSPLSKMIPFQY